MPIPNMTNTVRRFATDALTRRRYAASSTSTTTGAAGLRVRGATTDLDFLGMAVDAPAEQSQLATTGQTAGRTIEVYTEADLRVADGDTPADVVIWQGGQYEVTAVQRWHAGWIVATASQITREPSP